MVLNMYWKITKQRILMLTFPQIQQQSRQIHLSISCIKGNHYSSYYKLLKHIAWILNLKQNYISYKGSKEHKGLPFTNLNMQDIDCTENKILKHCQLECFENEFVDLGKGLPFKIDQLIPLSPFS